MAYVSFTVPIREIRGTVGGHTYRRCGNRTIITKKPEMGEDDPSEDQQANRDLFTEASEYGNRALADPELGPLYRAAARKRGIAVFGLFQQDYRRPPKIEAVNVARYGGVPGDPITIWASDVFMVAGVTVAILDEDGRELEWGEAEMTESKTSRDGKKTSSAWTYAATAAAPAGTRIRLVVTAHDVPGNTYAVKVPVSLDAREAGAFTGRPTMLTGGAVTIFDRPDRADPDAAKAIAASTTSVCRAPAWPSLEDIVVTLHVEDVVSQPHVDAVVSQAPGDAVLIQPHVDDAVVSADGEAIEIPAGGFGGDGVGRRPGMRVDVIPRPRSFRHPAFGPPSADPARPYGRYAADALAIDEAVARFQAASPLSENTSRAVRIAAGGPTKTMRSPP